MLSVKERQPRVLDERVMNPLSPKQLLGLARLQLSGCRKAGIRRHGVPENVGSNPTALTAKYHRVDQLGVVASFGSRRTQVQILPR